MGPFFKALAASGYHSKGFWIRGRDLRAKDSMLWFTSQSFLDPQVINPLDQYLWITKGDKKKHKNYIPFGSNSSVLPQLIKTVIRRSSTAYKVWETLIWMTCPRRSCLAGPASRDRRIAGLVCAKKSFSEFTHVLEHWPMFLESFLDLNSAASTKSYGLQKIRPFFCFWSVHT